MLRSSLPLYTRLHTHICEIESFGCKKTELQNRSISLHGDLEVFISRCQSAYPCFFRFGLQEKHFRMNERSISIPDFCFFAIRNALKPELSCPRRSWVSELRIVLAN